MNAADYSYLISIAGRSELSGMEDDILRSPYINTAETETLLNAIDARKRELADE